MPTLSGEVQRVTFENEETGFRVLKLTAARAPGNAPPPERSTHPINTKGSPPCRST